MSAIAVYETNRQDPSNVHENSPLVLQSNETTIKTVSVAENTITLEEADEVIKNLDNHEIEKLKIDYKNLEKIEKILVTTAFLIILVAFSIIIINPLFALFAIASMTLVFCSVLVLPVKPGRIRDEIKKIEARMHSNPKNFSETFKQTIKSAETASDSPIRWTFTQWQEMQASFLRQHPRLA